MNQERLLADQPLKQPRKRLRLPKRIFRNSPAFLKDVEFRPARSVKEMLAASHLVYKEYLDRGYVLPQKNELHFSLYQILPTTITFVAVYKGGQVLGAATLIEDSPLGVPMDAIYRDELDRLRAGNRRFIEVGMLALDEDVIGKGDFAVTRSQRLLFLLMIYQAIYHYFRVSSHIDELVACFHPSHEFMYDWIGFTPLGGLKSYSTVQGSPAVARHLVKKDQLTRALTDPCTQDLMFFWEQPPAPVHTLCFSADELRLLFVDKTGVLASATPEQRTVIQQLYPGYDFNEILKSPSIPNPPDVQSSSPLMDLLLKSAGKKSEGEASAHAELNEAQKISAAFRRVGFRKGDRLAVITSLAHEREWRIARQAAGLAGGSSVGISTEMTAGQVEKILTQFPAAGLVVECREHMVNIPDQFLDGLKFIVLLEDEPRGEDGPMLIEVLFSPPVCAPSALFFWTDLSCRRHARPSDETAGRKP